ncbi:MAG: OmpA family protein [Bacteroidia bacterium]|nr:OmpA family protein [Bacteroidia bacterium]
MKIFKILPLLFIIICSAITSTAQKTILQRSIYFESAKYNLNNESNILLDAVIDSLKNFRTYKIYVKGNTDNIGDSIYNKNLSEQRISAVTKYFISKGVNPKLFVTAAFGEEKPISENNTDEGKKKNRRVDISVSYLRNIAIDSSQFLPSIWELYKLTEIKPYSFCINNNRDTVLRCAKGTIIYVKANSFKIAKSCKNECVILKVKEDFLKSEMILDNLSTKSNGKLIETQGMIYTEANDCRGNKLGLLKGKDLIIIQPTDTVISETKIFEGNRTAHDSIMNWTINNSSVLKSFTFKSINYCSEQILLCGGGGSGCDCPFFICRIKRLKVSLTGLFIRCTRYDNRMFRTNLRLCKLRKKNKGYNLEQRISNKENKKIRLNIKYNECYRSGIGQAFNSLPPQCKKLKFLFDSFGVNNYTELLYAINKQLLDSFGVKTLTELTDTMNKVNLQNVELSYLNKTLNFNDFQFYIYNITRLGWSNVDVFANIPKEDMITMQINLKVKKNTDCKIVFKNRRFVIPAETSNKNYQFDNVPKGEEVWIIALKYLDGVPYLSMEETTTSNKTYDVNFKLYTLEELKKKLDELDK